MRLKAQGKVLEGVRLVSRQVVAATAAHYGVQPTLVAGVGHGMMQRAGGDWERAGRELLRALRVHRARP